MISRHGGHAPRSRSCAPEPKTKKAKTILRLPDLKHAKNVVLSSLNSSNGQPAYRHAIDEFVHWTAPNLA